MIFNFIISALILQTKSLMTEDEINDFFHNMIFCAYERGSDIINENCLLKIAANTDFQRVSRSRQRRDSYSSYKEDEKIDICQSEKCSRQSLFININVSLSSIDSFFNFFRRILKITQAIEWPGQSTEEKIFCQ